MYTFRTTGNRQPKRKSAEVTGAGQVIDNNKENVTLEIKDEPGGLKKPLHELPPAPKIQAKYTRKMQDHDMTKEVLTSFLTSEEDEIEITLSGYAKRIKKSMSRGPRRLFDGAGRSHQQVHTGSQDEKKTHHQLLFLHLLSPMKTLCHSNLIWIATTVPWPPSPDENGGRGCRQQPYLLQFKR